MNKGSASPSVITAWPTALKYVMKTVAQNETLQYRIRRLIASQHEHEKTWWQGRQRLLAKQKARAGNQKKLDEVLYESLVLRLFIETHETNITGLGEPSAARSQINRMNL